MHALLWVAGAIGAVSASDFVKVVTTSKSLNNTSFTFGVGLLVLVSAGVARIAWSFPPEPSATHDDVSEFERTHPKFVLATTLGGIVCFISLTVGLWPVYRIFTPFLLALIWTGSIMSLHFLP